MMEERIYTVPLSEAYSAVRGKRARKAVKVLKMFASRHMKVDIDNVKISAGVNSLIWSHGIQKPPRKIKVKMVKEKEDDAEVVKVMLLDEKWKVVKINYPEEEGSEKPKGEAKEKETGKPEKSESVKGGKASVDSSQSKPETKPDTKDTEDKNKNEKVVQKEQKAASQPKDKGNDNDKTTKG